jgi:hypothetical protein
MAPDEPAFAMLPAATSSLVLATIIPDTAMDETVLMPSRLASGV